MQKYYFHLTDKFQIEAAIKERDSGFLCELICDAKEMTDLINIMQTVVDAVLIELEYKSKKLSTSKPNQSDRRR